MTMLSYSAMSLRKRHHTTVVVIHCVKHAGIDLHAARLDRALLFTEFVPWLDHWMPVSQFRVMWRHLGILGSLPAHGLQSFVSIVVFSAVLRQPGFRDLHGIMYSSKREISEKWFAIAPVFPNSVDQESPCSFCVA